MDFIKDNYTWLFSGIGVVVLATVFKIFGKQFISMFKNTPSHNNTQNVIVNNNFTSPTIQNENEEERNDRYKLNTKILFVDDKHTEFKIVSILKKMGWVHTKSIKDVLNLDDPKVVDSDIIFVDINGVGATLFNDEGLGLASALKKKYVEKKIVIYSANPDGDRFHKALREVDDCLPKDAEPFQFSSVIEGFAQELSK